VAGRSTRSLDGTGAAVDEEIKRSIREFNARTIYPSLDVETLSRIPDDKVEQAIFDYAQLKIGRQYDREVQIVRALAPGVRALYVTWLVDGEVNNGGFNQYFWNTRGELAEEAVTGFMLFGAAHHAALMQEAIQARAQEAPEMERFREDNTLESFSESYEHTKLGELDEKFYELAENLSELRLDLVRRRPDLFVGS
jgi:hypothetical protein